MKTAGSFSDIEMRLLAVLEEAGEENFCTLVNTVVSCSGEIIEAESVGTALHKLLELSLIELAIYRDSRTLRWLPLPTQNSFTQLQHVSEFVSWSQRNRLWEWKGEPTGFEVLLTDKGLKDARKLLAQHGWELVESPITLIKKE